MSAPLDRTSAVDTVLALVLTCLGLVGFHAAFDGPGYLVVGMSAAVLGAAVAVATRRFAASWLPALAVLLVVFAVAGPGLATRGQAWGGVVPTPSSLAGLVDGLVHGWSRLLTSLPRSGSEDHVLAVPYVCGFVTALTTTLLALRSRFRSLCALPPFLLLAVTVLLGTSQPVSLLLQGGALAVVSLGWLAHRHQRTVAPTGLATRRRAVRAASLLGLAGAVGYLAGPALPFAQAQERLTLREHITPPFDLRDRPSPLGGFRGWLDPQHVGATVVVLDGWLQGARLRLATMDAYDGTAWQLAGTAPGSSAVYERIGTTLPGRDGTGATHVTVRPAGAVAPYVPTFGVLSSIHPSGLRGPALVAGLRVSRATGTALQIIAPTEDDAYTVSADLPASPTATQQNRAAFDRSLTLPPPPTLPTEIKAALDAAVERATTPYAKVQALSAMFRDKGYYSDGGRGQGVAPGHSLARLLPVLAHPDTARGDGEQYAAALALAARLENIPARVVIGFAPQGSGHVLVKGSDVSAWVEVAFDQLGWIAFDPTPDKNRTTPKKQVPLPKQQQVRLAVPPLRPPHTDPGTQAAEAEQKDKHPAKPVVHGTRSLAVQVLVQALQAGGALLLLSSPFLVIALLKVRRRRRRRADGDAADRLAAGWRDLVDVAVDARQAVPVRATRREVAVALGGGSLERMAEQADAAVFSAAAPQDSEVRDYWERARLARDEILARLTRWQRLRAAVSTRSLRAAT